MVINGNSYKARGFSCCPFKTEDDDLDDEDKPTDEDHHHKKKKGNKVAGEFDMANFMYTKQPSTI